MPQHIKQVNQEKSYEDLETGKLKQIICKSNPQDTGEGKSQNSSVTGMDKTRPILEQIKEDSRKHL